MQHARKWIRAALLGCCLAVVAACEDSVPTGADLRRAGTPAGLAAGWHSEMQPTRPAAPPTAPTPPAASGAAPPPAAADAEQWDLAIEADPDIGRAPLSVQFTAILDVERLQPVSFLWDFGDGEHGSGNPVRHTYRAAGAYTAAVQVVAGDERSVTGDVIVQVDDPVADGNSP